MTPECPSQRELASLADALREAGESSYDYKNGCYAVRRSHALGFDNWRTARDMAASFSIPNEPDKTDAYRARFQRQLEQMQTRFGLVHFQELAQSDSAYLAEAQNENGQYMAIRTTFFTGYSNGSWLHRTVLPYIPQPIATAHDEKLLLEMTPIVQMVRTSSHSQIPARQNPVRIDHDLLQTLDRFMSYLLEDTVFDDRNEFLKDLAVLPDGTPVNVDPGAIRYDTGNNDFYSAIIHDHEMRDRMVYASLCQIQDRILKSGTPSTLSPWTEDGRLKQNVFFPAGPSKFKPDRTLPQEPVPF